MRRTLVVDDNAVNRKLAVALLKRRGWVTEEADNGMVAMQKLANGEFDTVLLDISMPGMSGEETCKHLRALPGGSSIRIIAYTAHAFPEERDSFIAAGFDESGGFEN